MGNGREGEGKRKVAGDAVKSVVATKMPLGSRGSGRRSGEIPRSVAMPGLGGQGFGWTSVALDGRPRIRMGVHDFRWASTDLDGCP